MSDDFDARAALEREKAETAKAWECAESWENAHIQAQAQVEAMTKAHTIALDALRKRCAELEDRDTDGTWDALDRLTKRVPADITGGGMQRLSAYLDRLEKRCAALEAGYPDKMADAHGRGQEDGFRAGVEAAVRFGEAWQEGMYAGSRMLEQMRALAPAGQEAPEWKPTHRHYKGGLYRVLTEAKHHESQEVLVVYENEHRDVWVRPKVEFIEEVHVGGIAMDRFERLSAPRQGGDTHWACACGWTGSAAGLKVHPETGAKYCPNCGATGGLSTPRQGGPA